MKSPAVSVIIPTYNRANFISQTLDSVWRQTFSDYEIIVVDDGSTDNTAQILASYGDRLQVIKLEENTGPSISRNIALGVARGEFIALLDSDDLWYPEMLATTVAHLNKHSKTDIVCGAWDYIDEFNHLIKPINKPSQLQAQIDADFLGFVATGNPFLVHALLIRRKCFDCCGMFDPTLKGGVDWDLWIRFAMHGHKVNMIDVPVARYRRHSGAITRDPRRMEQASEQILHQLFSNEQFADRLADLRDHAYIQMWLTLAKYCHEEGTATDRHKYVQRAQTLYPNAPKNKQLDQLHLSSLLLLPETEDFRRMIVASNPKETFRYYYSRTWQLVKSGHFSLIFERVKPGNLLPFLLGFKDALSRSSEKHKF